MAAIKAAKCECGEQAVERFRGEFMCRECLCPPLSETEAARFEAVWKSRSAWVHPKPLGDFDHGWRAFRDDVDRASKKAIKGGNMRQPMYNPIPRGDN